MGSKGLLFKMVRCIIFIFLGAGVNFANCQDTVNFYNPEFWKFDSATINSLKLVFPKANIQDVIIQDSKAPDFVMDVYCLPLGSTDCESGWTFSAITRKCYKVITSPKFWDDARSDCRSVSGGELASVTSSQINDFLRTLTKSLSWVGGYRSGSNWLWTDGSSFSYTNWSENEPNNAGGQEDKIVFNWFGNQWNDSPGEFKYPYICQRSGADLSTRKEELIEELKNVTSRMRNDYASQNTPFADLGVCPGKIVKLWRQRKGIADCKPCCCHKSFIKQTVCKNYKGIP